MKTLKTILVFVFIIAVGEAVFGCDCYQECDGCFVCEAGVCVEGECGNYCESCLAVYEDEYYIYGECECYMACCYHGVCDPSVPGNCRGCNVLDCTCPDDDSKCGACENCSGGWCIDQCTAEQVCQGDSCKNICGDCQTYKDGVCTNNCDGCEKCSGKKCVPKCGSCQTCNAK